VLIADGGDDAAALAAAGEFIRWFRGHEPEARRFAAAKLLDIHNHAWSEGQPITAEAFAERMTLQSIALNTDGPVSLCYEDGDLFWGHMILVRMSEERTFEDAAVAG